MDIKQLIAIWLLMMIAFLLNSLVILYMFSQQHDIIVEDVVAQLTMGEIIIVE